MEALILSWATDTNGQNERFVRASEKWGDDETVRKVLAIGNADPGGVVARFKEAADKTEGLRIRSVSRVTAYMQFPRDIAWTKPNLPLIRELADSADVIHLNNSDVAARRLRLRKPMLLHHHGSLFRSNPKRLLDIARQLRMTQCVSTLDLTRPAPDLLHWLPTAYDVDWLEEFGKGRRKGARYDPDRIRIVHCPTNREFKATASLTAAVAELQAEGLPVDLILVEGKPWVESLLAKATADIVFDQLAWGYGCNAVEAWGLGVPVVSGADEWTLQRMRQEFGKAGLPFMEATAETLKDVIRELVVSKDLRAKWAAKGMRHVRKYHDERPALAKLAELYGMTVYGYEAPRRARLERPVKFRCVRNRVMQAAEEQVVFVNGEYATSDPFVIQRLRYFAQQRPAFGITEVAE